MGVSGQRHAPTTLYPVQRSPGTQWIGGWVGPRAGLDTGVGGRILFLFRGSNNDDDDNNSNECIKLLFFKNNCYSCEVINQSETICLINIVT
jgi:hypothetical protein